MFYLLCMVACIIRFLKGIEDMIRDVFCMDVLDQLRVVICDDVINKTLWAVNFIVSNHPIC